MCFSFEISTYREQFKVDPRSGEVTLAAQLDYEKKTVYNISVTVKDGGNPMLLDNAMVSCRRGGGVRLAKVTINENIYL